MEMRVVGEGDWIFFEKKFRMGTDLLIVGYIYI